LAYLIVGQQLWTEDAVVAVVWLLVGKGAICNSGDIIRTDERNLAICTGRIDLALVSDRGEVLPL
jgi:hypothetical protein